MRRRIFLLGQCSADPASNLRMALAAADACVLAGFAPYVPALSLLWQVVTPRAAPDWWAITEPWLAAADAALCLPGVQATEGKDELAAARLGVRVYHCLRDLVMEVR